MTCQAIICDWNGTLYKETDEEALFRALALDLARSYLPWHPLKILHLLRVKQKLESLNTIETKDSQKDHVEEIFRIYNEEVIRGVPVDFIRRSVEKYAGRQDVQAKVIWPVLKSVVDLHRAGFITGILSAGYEYGIRKILESGDQIKSFDFIEANSLACIDGKGIGFKLDIYKKKSDVLLRILKEKKLDAKRVVYMGDSLDDTGCFEIIGHPVVSLLAPEELKERFARDYKAFVPKDEAEMAAYLKKL